jgi:uncharacterized protein YyaL (SSP411 family)
LIWGLLELFQADGDVLWLDWALNLQARLDARFWDAADGGWFSTSGEDPTVLLRLKEDYDGAEPAATSVATGNLLTIAHLTGEAGALAKAEHALARYGPRVGAAARVVPMMLCALSAWHARHAQIVVVGDSHEAQRELLSELARMYQPFAIVIPVTAGASQQALAGKLPFIASMTTRDGIAAAYVCRNFACRQPVTSPEALRAELAANG